MGYRDTYTAPPPLQNSVDKCGCAVSWAVLYIVVYILLPTYMVWVCCICILWYIYYIPHRPYYYYQNSTGQPPLLLY